MYLVCSGAFVPLLLLSIVSLVPWFSQPPTLRWRLVWFLCVVSGFWWFLSAQCASAFFVRAGWCGTVLTLAAAYDGLHRIIPDRLLLVGFAGLLAMVALFESPITVRCISEAFKALLLMVTLARLSKGALGGGDVKLVAFAAAALGFRLALMAAGSGFLLLGLCAVLGLPRRSCMKEKRAYAPYFFAAVVLIVLLGRQISEFSEGVSCAPNEANVVKADVNAGVPDCGQTGVVRILNRG